MLSPRTMIIVKIIVLAMSRNIFNGIYFVLKSLEHDLEYKLLFFGLSFGLFYRSCLTSWISNKRKCVSIYSHSACYLGVVTLLGNCETY